MAEGTWEGRIHWPPFRLWGLTYSSPHTHPQPSSDSTNLLQELLAASSQPEQLRLVQATLSVPTQTSQEPRKPAHSAILAASLPRKCLHRRRPSPTGHYV